MNIPSYILYKIYIYFDLFIFVELEGHHGIHKAARWYTKVQGTNRWYHTRVPFGVSVCSCTRREILYSNSSEACGALLEGSNVGRDKDQYDLNESHCLHVESSTCVEYGGRVVEKRWTWLREYQHCRRRVLHCKFVF